MSDATIEVNTVSASDGAIVTAVVGAPVNDTYTASVSGNQAIITIPEADLVTANDIPVDLTLADGAATDTVTEQFDVDLGVAVAPLDAGAIFVSPSGSASNDGTEASPLASIEDAADSLSAGQTLYLRDGEYTDIVEVTNTNGTSANPIKIKAYPGEKPVVDTSLDVTWAVFDAANDIYITTANQTQDHLSGQWFDGVKWQSLIYYQNQDDFESNIFHVSASRRYVGPGLWNDGSKIRIRTTPVPASVLPVGVNTSVVFDPRSTDTKITNIDTAIAIDTSHVVFDGVDARGSIYGYEVKSLNQSIKILNGETNSAAGVLLRSGSSYIEVRGMDFKHTFPEWLAWTDIKGGSDGQSLPADHSSQRSSGVNAEGVDNLIIAENNFERTLDGGVLTDCENLEIYANTGTTLDDFFQLKTDNNFVLVYQNDMYGPGPSHHGAGTPDHPGTKYIFDNKFQGILFLWGKSDPGGMLSSARTGLKGSVQFSSHSTSNAGAGDPWKIYNNYVSGYTETRSNGLGYALWDETNSTSETHDVFNNIFEVLDDGYHDSDLDTTNSLQDYNGNTYIGGKFRENAAGSDYDTLPQWQAAFPSGWDQMSTDTLNASDPVVTLPASFPSSAELNAYAQRGPQF